MDFFGGMAGAGGVEQDPRHIDDGADGADDEHYLEVEAAGKRRPVHAADVPVKKTEADNRRNLRKARIKE